MAIGQLDDFRVSDTPVRGLTGTRAGPTRGRGSASPKCPGWKISVFLWGRSTGRNVRVFPGSSSAPRALKRMLSSSLGCEAKSSHNGSGRHSRGELRRRRKPETFSDRHDARIKSRLSCSVSGSLLDGYVVGVIFYARRDDVTAKTRGRITREKGKNRIKRRPSGPRRQRRRTRSCTRYRRSRIAPLHSA